MTTTEPVYYDPYDFEIDTDPYPVWRRMRDETPLYRNEQYDFWALSRFADVERTLIDHETFISGKGTVLDLLIAGVEVPPGNILMEDPPSHDLHRAMLSRVFTPRRMLEIEPQVRAWCAQALDRFVGADGFDFISDLGAFVPMKVIGMLLGIPESDQEAIRDAGQERHTLKEAKPVLDRTDGREQMQVFADYVDWRVDHPSDDLMTALLTVEFEDSSGVTRRLSRDEVLMYTNLLASAGNETTRRLIGWTGQVLADHADQRREIAAERGLINPAIEELLRYETPSPINARVTSRDVELHGEVVPEGSRIVVLNGSANRDERHFENPDVFDIHRTIDRHLSFGFGLHYCLGANLAKMEARVVLDEVLNRWTDWEVDVDRAVLDHTSTTRGWLHLPIVTG